MVQLESDKLDNGRTIYYEFNIKDSYQIIQKNNHIVSSKLLTNFFDSITSYWTPSFRGSQKILKLTVLYKIKSINLIDYNLYFTKYFTKKVAYDSKQNMFLIADTMGLVIWEWKKFYKSSKYILLICKKNPHLIWKDIPILKYVHIVIWQAHM